MKLNIIFLVFTFSGLISFDWLCQENVDNFKEEEILDIYAKTEFLRDLEQQDTIIKYQLGKKTYLMKYKEQLSLIAKSPEKWEKFAEKAVDLYIQYITKSRQKFEFEINYFQFDGTDPLRRSFVNDTEIPESDINVYSSYAKVYRINYSNTKQKIIFKIQFYKDKKIVYTTYRDQSTNRALKTLYFNDKGDISNVVYHDYTGILSF